MSGNGSGPYTLNTDQNWLSANPSSGTLASGASAIITVSASAQYLAPGSYTGHVTAGSAVFTVNFTVAGLALFASPSPANFNVRGRDQTVVQLGAGSGRHGSVNIAVTNGSAWLSADATVQSPASV